VPKEELEADDSDKIIGAFHFSKDVTRTHGVPFKFVVKQVCYRLLKVLGSGIICVLGREIC